jgi:hypothetical protein
MVRCTIGKYMIGPAEIADMLSDYDEALAAAGLPAAPNVSWPLCAPELVLLDPASRDDEAGSLKPADIGRGALRG